MNELFLFIVGLSVATVAILFFVSLIATVKYIIQHVKKLLRNEKTEKSLVMVFIWLLLVVAGCLMLVGFVLANNPL